MLLRGICKLYISGQFHDPPHNTVFLIQEAAAGRCRVRTKRMKLFLPQKRITIYIIPSPKDFPVDHLNLNLKEKKRKGKTNQLTILAILKHEPFRPRSPDCLLFVLLFPSPTYQLRSCIAMKWMTFQLQTHIFLHLLFPLYFPFSLFPLLYILISRVELQVLYLWWWWSNFFNLRKKAGHRWDALMIS